MLEYKAIDIFTSEETRYKNKPVSVAVVQYIHNLKIAARCMVTRGIAGCYESGEVTTRAMEIISYNLPLRIYIVLPAAEIERVLDGLKEIITDGMITVHDIQVVSHRAHNAFLPRHLRVQDVMTHQPRYVEADSAMGDAARLLLSSIFTGLPVVDHRRHPIGIITQGDLIHKGGMPLRLGLLAQSDRARVEQVLAGLNNHSAHALMSSPAVTVEADRPLDDAVALMLEKGLKRLPVVNASGALTGMLSRLDIFKSVMDRAPDWNAFQAQKVEVTPLRLVRDILRRDIHTVLPDATVADVIGLIDQNDIQRVAVVDENQKLLGIVSDRDLLAYFQQDQPGIWGVLAKAKEALMPQSGHIDMTDTKVADIMCTTLITVREDQLIEEAIGLMTEKALKRLPVVDGAGNFKGMISRDSLLRTGYELSYHSGH